MGRVSAQFKYKLAALLRKEAPEKTVQETREFRDKVVEVLEMWLEAKDGDA